MKSSKLIKTPNAVYLLALIVTLASCAPNAGVKRADEGFNSAPLREIANEKVVTEENAISLALNNITSNEFGFKLSHPRHTAEFDAKKVSFSPKRSDLFWNWKLADLRFSDGTAVNLADLTPRAPYRKDPLTIRYDRGCLEEQYLAKAKTIEQRFVIPARLVEQKSDLIIEGTIESNGSFSNRSRSGGWAWEKAGKEITFGHLHVFDADGTTIPSTIEVTENSAVIRVDGAYLAAATYPVTIDPEIGTGDVRLSDMGPDGDANYQVLDVAIAYNSTNNEYLVVWHGDDNSGTLVDGENEVFGQRINALTGAEVGMNDFRISDMGTDGSISFRAQNPEVAYNSTNNEYLVVWWGDDNTAPLVDNELEVFGQRLNAATGAEVGTNDFRISDMGVDGVTTNGGVHPNVAYNSTNNEYFVVWYGDDGTDEENEIWGQRINAADGTEAGANDIRLSDLGPDANASYQAFMPAVAYNSTNNEYLVVWYGDDNTGALVDNEDEIYGQRVNAATGAELGTNDARISDMGPDGNANYDALSPSVAYDSGNNRFLVVWVGSDNSGTLAAGESEVWGQLVVGSTGAETGTNDFRISDMGTDGDASINATLPQVAHNSLTGEYLVVWQADDDTPPLINEEVELYGQRITASGAEIGTNDFRLSDMGPDGDVLYNARSAHLAYNTANNQYYIAWRGDDNTAPLVNDEFEVFGQRYTDEVADLSVTQSDSPDPVVAGSTVTYTVTATNLSSSSAAYSVNVTDTLPSGVTFSSASGENWSCSHSAGTVTCTASSLSPSTSSILTITGSVDAAAVSPLSNTSLVGADKSFDPESSNDMDVESTTVHTPTPTSTPTATPTATNTPVPVSTSTPTPTATATPDPKDPDLVATIPSIKIEEGKGKKLTVSAIVKCENTGRRTARASRLEVMLKTIEKEVDEDDNDKRSRSVKKSKLPALKTDEVYEESVSFEYRPRKKFKYYLVAFCDSKDQVEEKNERNNRERERLLDEAK